jgi:hypothetical protein
MNQGIVMRVSGICVLLMVVSRTGSEVFMPGMQPGGCEKCGLG